MVRRYFGTDGIRGEANKFPMTAETALRLGMAAGRVFKRGAHRHRVVIGKDTRLSGYMVESALVAGLTSMGMDAFLLGPLPTPAVAFITRSLRADLGVMISASHNDFSDNGIKLFGPDGRKLSDETEQALEAHMDNGIADHLVAPTEIGRARRVDDARARYIEFAKSSFPKGLSLERMRVVVDCAHGAAYKAAPAALWELGADVVPVHTDPDGLNINRDCGSTSPEAMCEAVLSTRADLGIAFDGDADRVVFADETGALVDGDQILACLAHAWKDAGRLSRPGVVATILSSLALERYLTSEGLSLARTQVGDRHIGAHMKQEGYNLGGETSGHILMSDFGTTGDGLVVALQMLAILCMRDAPASEVCHLFQPLARISHNLALEETRALDDSSVTAAVEAAKARLGAGGRIILRASGTEPLVRLMGESDDEALLRCVLDDVRTALHKRAA